MTGRRDTKGEAGSRQRAGGSAAAAFATLVVPPASLAAALGLGVTGVALDSAVLGAAAAAAGCLGGGVAYWHTTILEGRFSHERMRNREAHRRLQLIIEDLRRRGTPSAPVVVDAPRPVVVPVVVPVVQPPVVPVVAEADDDPGVLVLDVLPDVAWDVDVPDVVPDEMPDAKPEGAPAVSMELPVLTTSDAPVAEGRLAAVVELRTSPRHLDDSPLPIGALERKVYAAIAAQDAQAVLAEPVEVPAEKQSVSAD